jgi:hypothetical protein
MMSLGLSCGSIAAAQTAPPYVGETVVAQNGALQGFWIEKRTCDEAGVCRTLIMNSQTLEVARVNDRLTSAFAATGNGLEIERAEPALDKAKRLKIEPS